MYEQTTVLYTKKAKQGAGGVMIYAYNRISKNISIVEELKDKNKLWFNVKLVLPTRKSNIYVFVTYLIVTFNNGY